MSMSFLYYSWIQEWFFLFYLFFTPRLSFSSRDGEFSIKLRESGLFSDLVLN